MPSLLGQQNAVPWKRLRNRRSGRQGGHPRPSRGPHRAPLPCPVMLLCLAWTRSGRRSAPFAGSPASSLPLPVPRGQHSGHTCPHPRCCLQLPVPPEDSIPGSPAGGEQEAAGDTWERAAGWPGLPAQCLQPRPRQGSPARARPGPASGASLLPWFQAFLGAENRNQPCVFQAARLLRNSCLSLGTETAFCPPLAPFRERDSCCLRAGFLVFLTSEKVLGTSFCPLCSHHPFRHRPLPQPNAPSCLRPALGCRGSPQMASWCMAVARPTLDGVS